MPEKTMENYISEVLTGSHEQNALDFAAYLRESDMVFVRGNGYWQGKLYWYIKYKNEYVCYILIGSEEKPGPGPWVVWSDDSGSECYENFPLDEYTKNILWKNIDFCGNGGCCNEQGMRKTIFGKEFNNVCRTTFKFINPDKGSLECMKKLVKIRKDDILKNI